MEFVIIDSMHCMVLFIPNEQGEGAKAKFPRNDG